MEKKGNDLAGEGKMTLRGNLGAFIRQSVGAFFVFATTAAAIYSVEKVVWVNPQPSLLLTLLLSVTITLILINVKLSGVVRHLSILAAGAVVYFMQASALVAPVSWWEAMHVKPNEGSIYFTSILMWGTWLLGYFSTWFMLRKKNAWVAVLSSVVVILINLNNLPARDYYRFFPAFVVAAVLLIGYAHLNDQLRQFEHGAHGYSKRGMVFYGSIVLFISVLAAVSSAFLPSVQMDPAASISSKISWNNSQEQWYNVFAAVSDKLEAAPVAVAEDTQIRFSDPPSEDKTLQFTVDANNLTYLRLRRYDNYTSTGWTIANTTATIYDPQQGILPSDYMKRGEFTYSITTNTGKSGILATGEMKTASFPVWLQYIPSQAATAADIVSIVSQKQLAPETTYTVTSWVTEATQQDLLKAGTKYPSSISDLYLQLPDTVPSRVKELSLQLTEGAQTQYEKVIDIKNFLQRFTYNVVFNSPPAGTDAVDYFLFEKKAGDCTYFASSMAVMLRSIGIPARITSGYRLVEKDPATGQFLVRSRDYHARTEVYFPQYGWIEFEVTPGIPGISTGVETIDLGDTGLDAAVVTHNVTMNMTKVKVDYVTYDEDGNLLDEFGNPIFQDQVNPGALPPNFPTTAVNATANVSGNKTPASQNTTIKTPSINVTSNHTANATRNATANASLSASVNVSPNATAVLVPGASVNEDVPGGGAQNSSGNPLVIPPLLIKTAWISLVGFAIGLVMIIIWNLWIHSVKRKLTAGGVYAAMCRLAALSRSGPKPFETPAEYGERLAAVFPAQGGVIGNITQIYTESRFSREKGIPAIRRSELEMSWFQLYPALITRIFRVK